MRLTRPHDIVQIATIARQEAPILDASDRLADAELLHSRPPRGSDCNIGSAAGPVHAVSNVRFAGRNSPSLTLLCGIDLRQSEDREDRYEEGNRSLSRGAAGRKRLDAAGRGARPAAGLLPGQLRRCSAARRYARRDLSPR